MSGPLKIIFEKIPGPQKFGRVETQTSMVGPPDYAAMISACRQHAADTVGQAEARRLALAGYRVEEVLDGAGVFHYNMYALFDPVGAELDKRDPSNLNH